MLKFGKHTQIGEVFKSPSHLKWIRQQPCCQCAKSRPQVVVDPHHTRQDPKGAPRMDDRGCVPLCRECHRKYHDNPSKAQESKFKGIAKWLWENSPAMNRDKTAQDALG